LFIIFLLVTTSAFAGYKVTGNLEVTGNAGIGSASPTQKLDVIGTAKATRFVGDGSGLTGISAMVYPDAGVAVSTGSAWGTSLSTDGSGDCGTGAVCLGDHTHTIYQAADATLTDIADGTIEENLINTTNPWADNEVSDTLTASIVSDADKGAITISSGVWSIDANTVSLGTTTTGNYVAGATASRGLLLTGTEGGTLGLIETCNSGELLKWNGSAWACAADTTGSSSGTPGGTTGQIQWTNAGVLDGVDGFIYNGSTNVGLGSVAPTQKLDVVGTVKATSFQGSGSLLTGVVTAEADTLDSVVGRGATTARAVTIGTTTAGTVNKVTITTPASGSTLTIADGKTLTVTNTVNLNTMTDGKWCKYTASVLF
jgi:hypothetical protein